MAKKNVIEEEVLEVAEDTVNDVIEGMASMELDISDIIGDDASLKVLSKQPLLLVL